MGFHKKISEWFKSRGISNREISKQTGYKENMVGRYLKTSKPNYEFLSKITEVYPDLDLNYLIKEKTSENIVSEDTPIYQTSATIIGDIEKKLSLLKEILTQNSHN